MSLPNNCIFYDRILFYVIAFVILSIFSPLKAEEIFRWVDNHGGVHFSNIKPPSEGVEYTQSTFSSTQLVAGVKNSQPDSILPKAIYVREPTPGGIIDHPDQKTFKKMLQKKIETCKKSIQKIESRLRTNPSNRVLRKHLLNRRICLQEKESRLNSL